MPLKRILRARFILPALVFLIPLVLYSITLTTGFVYDDEAQVVDNPWIRDPGKIPTIFVSSTMAFLKGHKANAYRPVFYLLCMAKYLIFGLRPWAWHLVNVVLHCMNALALYFLASIFFSRQKTATPDKDATRPWALAPLFTTLVFALHPIKSEVAAWWGL
ncbi:MAG: hypothetical protein ACE5EZ_03365 [Thermodesulfobacteriota bacterium]